MVQFDGEHLKTAAQAASHFLVQIAPMDFQPHVGPVKSGAKTGLEQESARFIVDTGQRSLDADKLMELAAAGAKMQSRRMERVQFAVVATQQELDNVLLQLDWVTRELLTHSTFLYDPSDPKSHEMALAAAEIIVSNPQQVIDRIDQETLAWFHGVADRLSVLHLYEEFKAGLESLQEAA